MRETTQKQSAVRAVLGAAMRSPQMTKLAACVALSLAMVSNSLAAPSPTGWPLEVLSWDLTKAYPGIRYEWRLGVKGGVYPYTFTLQQGPSGMTVDADRGVIRWLAPSAPSSGNAVQIRITDTMGAILTHSYSIDVTTAGFFFVAATGGSDTNPGTLALPWATIAKAQAAAGDGIVYVKSGTYNAAAWSFQVGNPNKWLAYPDESVILDLVGDNVGVGKSYAVVNGFEIRNSGAAIAKMFWVSGPTTNLIWRNNVMHGVNSTGANNPAFIFFEDDNYRPIDGLVQYDRVVVQDNTFYDLINDVDHGASVTCYNVKNLLYEDNEAYQIDGRGVSDKDDGYYNTFRNNVLHDMGVGVGLFSQITQGQIEVCYNLIYNCPRGIAIGAQPGYVRDVFVHRNTIVAGAIDFGSITDGVQSTNFNIYGNIISNGSGLLYSLYPVSNGAGGYGYPSWVGDPARAQIDNNLLWTTGSFVAGFSWGLVNKNLTAWQTSGYDVNSIAENPALDASYSLPAGSPYLGLYGRDRPTTAVIRPSAPSSLRVGP